MTLLFVIPIIILGFGIYLLSQLLIILPLFILALLILYTLKLIAFVPGVVIIFAALLFFGRKKTCKRCAKPEEKCDICGK